MFTSKVVLLSSPNEENMTYSTSVLQRLKYLSPETPGRPSVRSFLLIIHSSHW
jgi:hypothetical protein